ncbi:MAG: hypothetical protein CVU65_05670 [Deltaproteobacteria bacterium HGW-Deltaproteobacteria-22]|jgi:hypothetical protein|nr:MAG: hypothetical protein CVU65_05670 [Deltaproteobacteria bacterium HGW-Deltaproteobacteria-22]
MPLSWNEIKDRALVVYAECVHAFNYGLHLSCAIGLRALMEGICVDKNVTDWNLGAKIPKLNAILPQNIVDNLHGFAFLGNDAAHRLDAVDKKTLQLAI